MKYIILVIAILFSGCNIEPDCSNSIDGGINGEILPLADQCDYDYKEMKLNSTGGDGVVAMRIGSALRAINDSKTIVERRCNSACAMVMSAASERLICERAWVGLHQAGSTEITFRMMNFFAQDDRIDYSWLDAIITNTPHEEVYWLSAYDAIRIGLADEIVTCE